MRLSRILPLVPLFACTPAAPTPQEGGGVCEAGSVVRSFPPGLEESSGVAASRSRPGVLWTHNDSGWPAEIFAVDSAGAVLARIAVPGARNVDWEDIALGPCGSGAGECLYVGDIGDNRAAREEIAVYRFPEPEPRPGAMVRGVERFPMRYPDGPRDAEGLFVLPGGEIYVVTKGGEHAAALYRHPHPARPGVTATLERVAALSAGPLELLDQLTGADASTDGEWVVIRSYRELRFHRARALVRGDTTPEHRFELDEVEEVQGEGVALGRDGLVFLTGEGGFDGVPGTVAVLRCSVP